MRLEAKLEIIFASLTVLLGILLSWIEFSDVLDSSCSQYPWLPFLLVRYFCYIFSKFYLLSLWNLDILDRVSYKVKDWRFVWPFIFQALSSLLLFDVFTYDYIVCEYSSPLFGLSFAGEVVWAIFVLNVSNFIDFLDRLLGSFSC